MQLMSPKSLTIDSCLFHLNSWKPFSNPSNPNPKTLDSDRNPNPNPNPKLIGINSKRPCLSDRSTSLFSLSIDKIDFSKLSIFDDGEKKGRNHHNHNQTRMEKLRWSMAKKRRRKCGSKSVSGRSSDRSGTRNGGCKSVGATCSDFMVANGGTDSSGELFGNVGNGWGFDVIGNVGNVGNGANVGADVAGFGFGFEGLGIGGSVESGYGSEPGYRGDVEYGYGGDEVDDDEDEGARLLFLWGQTLGDSKVEMVGENTFSEQKTHHRGRRKKHDLRMVDSVR